MNCFAVTTSKPSVHLLDALIATFYFTVAFKAFVVFNKSFFGMGYIISFHELEMNPFSSIYIPQRGARD